MNRAPGLLAVAAGVLGASLHAVNAAAGRTLEPSFWLLSVSGAVGYGVLALLLERVTPAVRVTVAAIGVLFGTALVASEWSLLAPQSAGADWAVWFGSWAWAPGYVALVGLLPSLLPDGRAPQRPWSWAPWTGLAAVVATALWWALLPYEDQDFATPLAGYANPVGTGLAATFAVELAVSGLMLVAAAGSIASLVARWRRSTGIARQQLKWVLLGVVATLLLLGLARAVPVPLSEVVAAVGMLPLPAAIAVAVLRHGLWDVDVVVSRALTYLAVAVVAGAGYALVAGFTTILAAGAPPMRVVAVALLAPLLVPVHAVVQRMANRWVHGFEDEPWTELVQLGDSLAAAADPDELVGEVLPRVVVRIRRALRASGVRLRLEDGSELVDGDLSATGEAVQVALAYAGERLGVLEVLRAGGFGGSEQAHLSRLAEQAGVAVHTVLLARDARRAREAIVLAREEERRRLRSDLHDGVGPSVAALALQVETARDLAGQDPEATAALLARLTPRINAVVGDVRALVHELRPPTLDELGLVPAVRELAARLSGGTVAATVEAGDLGSLPLPAGVEVAAYRIAGEAIANAVRHADASHVSVRLERDPGGLVVEVRDDGHGLGQDGVARGSGLGLSSMRARCEELGGAFVLTSDPGGTTVTARMPLPDVDQEAS